MCTGFFYDLNIYMDNTPQLSITDLAVIKKLIEVASTRGAWQAPELKTVGEVYERLSSFLDTLVQQAEAQAQAETQGETK